MQINFHSLRKNYSIFFNDNKTIEFSKEILLIKEEIICEICSSVARLRKKSRDKSKYAYQCISSNCKKWFSLCKIIDERLPKIPISKLLFIFYNYSIKTSNYQQIILNNISEHTLITIKDIINQKLLIFLNQRERIGGPGHSFQIDETACNRRRLITNPTSEEVTVRNTVWVIGIIHEETKKQDLLYYLIGQLNQFLNF